MSPEEARPSFEKLFAHADLSRDLLGRYRNPIIRSAWTWFTEGMKYKERISNV